MWRAARNGCASVPKHILIYQYLGLEPPVFMHLSLMRNADKSKLSKRKNPTSISYYTALGYLPEALMNFLGLFFIQIAEGEEMLTMDELAEKFDPDNLSKAGAIFDIQKLDWLNGRWLRESLTEDEFAARVLSWAMENDRLKQGLKLSQSRISKLGELPDLAGFLFKSDLGLDAVVLRQDQVDAGRAGRDLQHGPAGSRKDPRMECRVDRGGTARHRRPHGQEAEGHRGAAVRGRLRLVALAAAVRFHGDPRPLGRAPAPEGRRARPGSPTSMAGRLKQA